MICQDKPINTIDIDVITQKIILAGVMAELWGHRWSVFSVADRGDGAGQSRPRGVFGRVWPPALLGSRVAGMSVPLAGCEGGGGDQSAGSATACWFGLSIAHLCGDLVCAKLRR